MSHAIYITTISITYKIDYAKKKSESFNIVLENAPLILNLVNLTALPSKTVTSLAGSIARKIGKSQNDISILKYELIEKKYSSKINYDYEQ